MKTEKIVISFIAVVIGILVAGLAFYFYQSRKVVPTSSTETVSLSPTNKPEQKSGIFLTLDSPKDEEVISIKTVSIAGKTTPDATIIVSTSIGDQVITPAANGNFSLTATLDDGENVLEITAIDKNGNEAKIIKTVTVSTETF